VGGPRGNAFPGTRRHRRRNRPASPFSSFLFDLKADALLTCQLAYFCALALGQRAAPLPHYVRGSECEPAEVVLLSSLAHAVISRPLALALMQEQIISGPFAESFIGD
jgi:hypothetical protein